MNQNGEVFNVQVIRMNGTSWLALEGKQGILIDAGVRSDGKRIIKRIQMLGIMIPLIFLTHTHYDHAGGAEAVRQVTGAKVVVGTGEAEALRKGFTPVPEGTGILGRFLSKLVRMMGSNSHACYTPVTQDIIEIDAPRALKSLGFDCQVYCLGAHTAGSIGLRVGDYFFAGDTAFNIGGCIYPPFADLPDEVSDAWQTILCSGAKMVFPGHGPAFSIETLKKKYQSRFLLKEVLGN